MGLKLLTRDQELNAPPTEPVKHLILNVSRNSFHVTKRVFRMILSFEIVEQPPCTVPQQLTGTRTLPRRVFGDTSPNQRMEGPGRVTPAEDAVPRALSCRDPPQGRPREEPQAVQPRHGKGTFPSASSRPGGVVGCPPPRVPGSPVCAGLSGVPGRRGREAVELTRVLCPTPAHRWFPWQQSQHPTGCEAVRPGPESGPHGAPCGRQLFIPDSGRHDQGAAVKCVTVPKISARLGLGVMP